MTFVGQHQYHLTVSPVTQIVDAAGEGVASMFKAPQAGVLDRVIFRTVSINGTPPTYQVRIETVDASGLPTGTLVAAGATQTFPPTATTWHTLTLGTPPTLVAGTYYAVVVTDDGVTAPDGTDNATFLVRSSGAGGASHPHAAINTGAGWAYQATNDAWPSIIPQYDSASNDRIVQGYSGMHSSATANFANDDSPDEHGILFTVPVAMDLLAVQMLHRDSNSSSDFDISLYNGDSTGDTDLVERITTIDASFHANNSQRNMVHSFASIHSLVTGTNYRLTLTPTSTNNIRRLALEFGSEVLKNMMLGSLIQGTSRTNAGSWTNSQTSISWLSAWFENYVAGGGGASRSLLGGLVS